jgi:cell division protein ZapA
MAEENKTLKITVHLYDTDMSVRISPQEEEAYRKAAKLIVDTMNTYVPILKGKRSEKDIMYAAMLAIALRYEQEAMRNDTIPFTDILGKLTSEIEEALKE